MNVTMIVPYYKPEITAVVRLLDDLARDLAGYGADVTVITAYPCRGIDKDLRERYSCVPYEQLEKNLLIVRTGSKAKEGSGFIQRGFLYLLKTMAFYKKAKAMKSDVYFIYSTPPAMGVMGALLSRRAPTLYCLQDVFPDNLVAQGMLRKKGRVMRILGTMETFIYRRNTKIVTISQDMKENLIKKGVDPKKLTVIGNWVDANKICYVPREENPLFDRIGLDRNRFYVSYSGNLGHAQDLRIILDSAKRILEAEPEIGFLIIGNGVCEKEIKEQVQLEQISNVFFSPLQPDDNSALVYSLGDIGLVTLKKGMDGKAMPSKTWAMMAASQPMICTAAEGTELNRIIQNAGCGVVIEPGNVEAMTNEILMLFRSPSLLQSYGVKGRLYAEEYLSRSKATRQYYDLMAEMIQERG